MPENETLDYLDTQLRQHIEEFDDSRRFYRRQQYRFTMGTAFLSAATTILIAFDHTFDFTLLAVFALFASASITVLATWDQFLRSKDLWIQKPETWMQLQNPEAHIAYSLAKFGSLSQDQIDGFYERFDRILMEEHSAWKQVREQPVGHTQQ